jgi:arylsulfatase A-like enzyme
MSISRRRVTGTLAAAAAAASCSFTKPRQARRNVLFIMSDDHAAGYLGCYGNSYVKTPNLDRLALDGTRFSNAFCTNSLCAPGRASILTGTYSHVNGIRGNSEAKDAVEYMSVGIATFPEILQRQGYHTGIVGKWHLSDRLKGFDYSCVLPGQGVYLNPIFHENGEARQIEGHVTDATTDLALKFLEASPAGKPWCLLYHHKAPHRPFQPPQRFANRFRDFEIPYPETFNDDYATRKVAREAEDMRLEVSLAADYPDLPSNLSRPEKKKWIFQRFARDYCAGVEAIDENIGRVLAYLDKNNLTEETLIIYTSDNGFFMGDHGWYDKRFMYEPSMRIPLLVRWPAAPKARLSEHLVANIDVAPTILDYAGVVPPEEVQGKTVRGIVNGGQQTLWRKSVYYTYYENSWSLKGKGAEAMADPSFKFFTPHRVGPHRGIRTGTHKLIHYYSDGDYYELFDLRKDPNELNNLYGLREESSLAADLRFNLQQTREFYGDTNAALSRPTPSGNPE